MSERLFTPVQMARCVLWLAKKKRWTVSEEEMFMDKFSQFAPTEHLVRLWCQRFLATGDVLDGKIFSGKYDKRKPCSSEWFDHPHRNGPDAVREANNWTPMEKAHCVFWYENTGTASRVVELLQQKFQNGTSRELAESPSELFIQLWRLRFIEAGRVVKEVPEVEPPETMRAVPIEDYILPVMEEQAAPNTPPPSEMTNSRNKTKILDISRYEVGVPEKIARWLQSLKPKPRQIDGVPMKSKRGNSKGPKGYKYTIHQQVRDAKSFRLRSEANERARRAEARAAGQPVPEEPIGITCHCRPKQLAKRKICTRRGPHLDQACYVCATPQTANPCAFLMWDPEDPKYYKRKQYHWPLTMAEMIELVRPTPPSSDVSFLDWE